MMRLHPVNVAEAVVAPFFDLALSPEQAWTLRGAPGTQNLRIGRAYTTTLYWDMAKAGERVLTWEWQAMDGPAIGGGGAIDVSRYNGLFMQAAFPSWVTLTLSACVDGTWQAVCVSPGCDSHADYTGPFTGRTLQGLRIELVSRTRSAGAFGTYYIGVYDQRRLDDWLAFENPDVYPIDWPEFIRPEPEWPLLTPQFGLYFDVQDLAPLRRKLSQPPYQEIARALRDQAHACLEWEPEKQIRQYMPCGHSPWAYSARGRDRGPALWGPLELCAFFGLLDGDARLVKMAARIAISLAHMRNWAEGFVEHDFGGSAMNWRSFYQNTTSMAVAAALDWIGGALTEHAREVLCHSLFFKGLAPLKFDFARYEYIYRMNQAIVFSGGRIAAALALNHHWPRLAPELEQARKDLDETARNIILDDGGYGEGPGYFSGVMYYMLFSYLLLARHEHTTAARLVPPGVLKGADYFGPFVSSSAPATRLPLSDGAQNQLPSDWIAMFAHLTADPRWNKLLQACLESDVARNAGQPANRMWATTGVRTLIFGPEDLTAQAEIVPVFKIHAGAGHATSRRNTAKGTVRLHLCGASSTEGHSHEDKGALLLESFGEAILIDRGITVYGDPITSLLKQASLHNIVTPLDTQGRPLGQLNPCPQAICPTGHGDETALHLRIDTTPVWGDAVRRAVRTLDSDSPLRFTLMDEIDLAQAGPVVLHLHSYAPIVVQGNTATFKGASSELKVTWRWPGEVIGCGEDLCDGEHQPVYHLAVRAPAAIGHALVTDFEIR
jgi:hypothetical protein